MSTIPSQVSILVVGSGPAGLSLAAAAITKGVDPNEVLVIEKRSAEAREAFKLASRANVIHAGTMEKIEEVLAGVEEQVSLTELDYLAVRVLLLTCIAHTLSIMALVIRSPDPETGSHYQKWGNL